MKLVAVIKYTHLLFWLLDRMCYFISWCFKTTVTVLFHTFLVSTKLLRFAFFLVTMYSGGGGELAITIRNEPRGLEILWPLLW